MTTNKIAQYLTHPALLDEESLSGIDELVTTYPWYAGGQMLLARNLYNLKHLRYPSRLKLASLSTIDRGLLKGFILNNNELPTVIESAVEIADKQPFELPDISEESERPEEKPLPFTSNEPFPFEPYTQFDFTSELLKLPEIKKKSRILTFSIIKFQTK